MLIFLYRLSRFLSLRLPLRFLYCVAVLLADFYFFFSSRDRKAVFDNLNIIFPAKDANETINISRQVFRNFAKYLVDFFRFDLLNNNNVNDFVEIENLGHLDRALKVNKGVIALTAHIGNWELGGAVLGVLGYRFSAIALGHKDKRINSFFNEQRNKKGVSVIQVNHSLTGVIKNLAENRIVAILADRDFTGSGLSLDFFGKEVSFPKGAAFFSIKTGAPIIIGIMLRLKDDKFKLVFEDPIIPKTDIVNDQNLKDLMQEYLSRVASYIIRYPEQWFMFRRFWEKQTV